MQSANRHILRLRQVTRGELYRDGSTAGSDTVLIGSSAKECPITGSGARSHGYLAENQSSARILDFETLSTDAGGERIDGVAAVQQRRVLRLDIEFVGIDNGRSPDGLEHRAIGRGETHGAGARIDIVVDRQIAIGQRERHVLVGSRSAVGIENARAGNARGSRSGER